ncbi:MAG: AEC family transporter [Bacteroidales bacterium]|jgi:predicted permease|nr:AEC family transporter [Bacteroidales bacterium]
MEHLVFSLNVVAPLFVLLALGYVFRLLKLVSVRFIGEATGFVFRFLLPLMLFQNIRSAFPGESYNIRLMLSAMAGVLAVILLSACLVPLFVRRRGQQGSMIQGIYRSNFLIYGMPLATGMYGQAAAHSISMLMGVMIPLYNISAVIILSTFSEKRKQQAGFGKQLLPLCGDIALNPLILGCVAGLCFGLSGVVLPAAIEKTVADIAGSASPVALFLTGSAFRFENLGGNIRKALAATIGRLIVVPLAAMIVFIAIGFRGLDLSVLLCLFATPTAVASYIMAENMGCDGELSAQIVVLTTVLSVISIFLFIVILRSVGFL